MSLQLRVYRLLLGAYGLRFGSRHKQLFHLSQGVFGDRKLVGKAGEVGEDKALGMDVNLIDEVSVDDEPFAYADKDGGGLAKLQCKSFLHLTEVQAYDARQFVGGDNLGIVSVSLEIDDVGDAESYQFIARIEIYIFHWLLIFLLPYSSVISSV